MRKISRDGIVVGFLDEGNRVKSSDSFLTSLNQTGVPECSVVRKGRITSIAVDEAKRVFPGSPEYVISLKNYLEKNQYSLQLMGDML